MIRLNISLIPNEDILQKLIEKNITTVKDFLQKPNNELQILCGIPYKEITKLKDNMMIKCSSSFTNGYKIYSNRSLSNCIKTGISKLDCLLGGGLFVNNIYEFCGPSACGKTQLCFSILSNVIMTTKRDVIYIDTKNEFSIKRVKQILRNKHHVETNQEINVILKKIWIYSVLDIYSLITCLYNFIEKSEPIIIIDSISTLYLSFIGFSKSNGLCYLNYIYSILKYLCNNNAATIVLTNLAIKNCDYINTNNEEVFNQSTPIDFKPAIGKYWLHIPSTRLMFSTLITNQINVHVSKSVNISLSEKCTLNINNNGIS